MSIFERVTSLFAPDECLSCRREGRLLCERCAALLAPPIGRCFDCKKYASGMVCATCLHRTGCKEMIAATDYQGLAKQLVASLKFAGNQAAARIMARSMADTFMSLGYVLITHMPATTAHIRERGYDQAALLGRHIARIGNRRHATLLARLGSKHQLGADREQRLEQLVDTLHVRQPDKVRGQHILLVDDVLTTGASVRAATTALLGAGAASVTVLVFAQSMGREGL